MRAPYPSSLTDAQWAQVRHHLRELADGRRRRWPPRLVIDAMLHLVRTGCQWRQLPRDFPPWQTVYHHHGRWDGRGLLHRLLECAPGAGHGSRGGLDRGWAVGLLEARGAEVAQRGVKAGRVVQPHDTKPINRVAAMPMGTTRWSRIRGTLAGPDGARPRGDGARSRDRRAVQPRRGHARAGAGVAVVDAGRGRVPSDAERDAAGGVDAGARGAGRAAVRDARAERDGR